MSWHSLPIFRDNDLYVDFNMLWEVGGYTSNHVYTRAVFEVLLRNTSHEPALRRLSSGGPCGQQARKCIGGRPPSPLHTSLLFIIQSNIGGQAPQAPLYASSILFFYWGIIPQTPLILGVSPPNPHPAQLYLF